MNQNIEFEKIYREYHPKVLAWLSRRINSECDAQDLAQEIMLVCCSQYSRFDSSRAAVGTWIYVIMRNRLKNYYRDYKKVVSLEDGWFPEPAAEDDLGQAVLLEELQHALYDAIAALKPREQEIIRRRYFQGQSAAQTGLALGMSEGTVRTATSRALNKLRRYMKKAGF